MFWEVPGGGRGDRKGCDRGGGQGGRGYGGGRVSFGHGVWGGACNVLGGALGSEGGRGWGGAGPREWVSGGRPGQQGLLGAWDLGEEGVMF